MTRIERRRCIHEYKTISCSEEYPEKRFTCLSVIDRYIIISMQKGILALSSDSSTVEKTRYINGKIMT